FAVILPHVDREGAAAVAEKLRAAIASKIISGDHGALTVTASFGTSALSIVTKEIETLVAQADAAMDQAKRGGRNRCVSGSSIHADHAIGARRR
ncbi:GGDEF domain-containing protein, partial [Rhizobium leguminosarum]|uniref:GGDEF domain-containing protein n=1 Tax=Rhizobium leguminosarum TaxID=384 RepID=UPI003F9C62C9